MKNRIQVINWRTHGSNESYCITGVFAANDESDLITEVRHQVDEDATEEEFDQAEERMDWDHVIYVNDDFTFEDGQILKHNGRSFRVNITEVSEEDSVRPADA
jgi:hypothetical protein